MWKFLKGEWHRIQQLHMASIIKEDIEDILALLQSSPAASLEHCMIGTSPVLRVNQKRSLSLFSGDGRILRSLYLNRASFLPSNTFPNLSCLIIDCTTYGSEYPHRSLEDLLNLLVGCPRLERLHLSSTWNWPYRTDVSADAPRVILPRLRIFTLDLEAHLIIATVQALLSIVKLPPICQIQLKDVPLNALQAIAPSLLSLERPFMRMHLALAEAASQGWSLILASHQPNYAAVRLISEYTMTRQVCVHLGPHFSKFPLFEDVEELWCRTDLLHEDILSRILLPPKVRSLALTVVHVEWRPDLSAKCFAEVARAGGQLDTLCICVPEAGHLRGAREALTGPGPGRKLGCCAIRRTAMGYEKEPSIWLSESVIESLGDWGAGTGVSWMGQIAGKRGGDDTEMDRLLRAAPQMLEEPASIWTDWPTWPSSE